MAFADNLGPDVVPQNVGPSGIQTVWPSDYVSAKHLDGINEILQIFWKEKIEKYTRHAKGSKNTLLKTYGWVIDQNAK